VDYLFPENAAISAECRDLIQKILVADPNKRLSIAEIFQHPWVQQVGGSGAWGCVGCGQASRAAGQA
jgi:serine/threonine protein kinase